MRAYSRSSHEVNASSLPLGPPVAGVNKDLGGCRGTEPGRELELEVGGAVGGCRGTEPGRELVLEVEAELELELSHW